MALTTHPHVAPRLKSKAIQLHPLWGFVACSRTNLRNPTPAADINMVVRRIELVTCLRGSEKGSWLQNKKNSQCTHTIQKEKLQVPGQGY
jgi:hypothetical protein